MSYLTDAEIRALGEFTIAHVDDSGDPGLDYCVFCLPVRLRPPWRPTDPAHLRDRGMGGRKQAGPIIRACRPCHEDQRLHHTRWEVTRAGAVVCVAGGREFYVRDLPPEVIAAHPELFESR